MRPPSTAPRRSPLQCRIALAAHRLGRLDPTVQGLLWSASAGAVFRELNALMRGLAIGTSAVSSCAAPSTRWG